MFKIFVYQKALMQTLFSAIVSHKHSCVTALFDRIITHCSEADTDGPEKVYLHGPFMGNGYPLSFIKQALHYRTSQLPPGTDSEVEPPTWRSFPYHKGALGIDH